MRIEMRVRGLEVDEDLRSIVERRLLFALGRFGARVQGVRVHLDDVNGPKGGVDKQCRILARLAPSGGVRVEDSDADAVVAVSRAADRLGRSVGRELARRPRGARMLNQIKPVLLLGVLSAGLVAFGGMLGTGS